MGEDRDGQGQQALFRLFSFHQSEVTEDNLRGIKKKLTAANVFKNTKLKKLLEKNTISKHHQYDKTGFAFKSGRASFLQCERGIEHFASINPWLSCSMPQEPQEGPADGRRVSGMEQVPVYP